MSLSENELLALSDEELFQGGGCHVFADELYERLASKGFVLRRIAEGELPRFRAHHVYVAKGDTAVDYRGIGTESGLIAERVEFRRTNNFPIPKYEAFPIERASLFQLCKAASDSGPHNCWYHRIGEHFVQECRRRAQAMIASAPAKYSPPE
jgi:hypothetical protein